MDEWWYLRMGLGGGGGVKVCMYSRMQVDR